MRFHGRDSIANNRQCIVDFMDRDVFPRRILFNNKLCQTQAREYS